jgi:enoyl reductase-like protein
MTYAEVLTRLVELLFVNQEKQEKLTSAAERAGQELPYPLPAVGEKGRWLDSTFFDRVVQFAVRSKERFMGTELGGVSTRAQSASALDVRALERDPENEVGKVCFPYETGVLVGRLRQRREA